MTTPSEYPPAEFCRKYASLLAPKGSLLPPERAFAAYTGGDPQVRKKTQKALKVTLKRLQKMMQSCVACGENTSFTFGSLMGGCDPCRVHCCGTACSSVAKPYHDLLCVTLRDQFLDQVIECLPSPVNLFAYLDFGKSCCPPGGLTWDLWFQRQSRLAAALRSAAATAAEWGEFAELQVQLSEVELCLQRVTTGLLTLPLTLVHCIRQFSSAPKHKTLHIHMVGADLPEVSMTYNGLCRLISGAGVRSVRITLVSPDHHVKAMSTSAPLERPMEAGPCQVSAWDGLYHDFHEKFIESGAFPAPHLVMCIHPGLHSDDGFSSWLPTLELLAKKNYPTAMTTYNEQEFDATIARLDSVGVNVIEKGENPMRSKHVKQTPKDRCLVWSSNAYLISFRGTAHSNSEFMTSEQ